MTDCCNSNTYQRQRAVRLVIIGGGSAAFAAAIRATELGARATIINDRLPIGGTCVNVGCVPSKTLIRAAEAHHRAGHHAFAGIESRSRVTSFPAIIRQKRELVEQLRQAKYLDVVDPLPGVRLVEGRARLVAPETVEVNGERIIGDRVLIATGVSPFVPAIPGLADAGYLTNESLFELDDLPESLIVLGGRYVAFECAQMMARFGSRVTILQRSDRILPTETADITDALTAYIHAEGIEVVTGVETRGVRREGDRLVIDARARGEARRFEASHILAATGRRPNTAGMGLEEVGVDLDRSGFVVVNDVLQTSVPGVYAAGDVIGDPEFVYTAAYEGALAAENAINGDARRRDYTALPWVVFTDPQLAGVGLDEQQAEEQGIEVEVATLPLSHVPRSLAARDTRGFIKLIRDRATDRLVGGRILAPEGSELLMEIALAIRYGITVEQIRSSFHPYLTLGEGVKLAAIAFGKDVATLSCCAT
ncbi:MAG: mercury(II) reductase [Tepidisphaera sp.]|nr:mercury(II) reductase [Tepidisphaera sp.]